MSPVLSPRAGRRGASPPVRDAGLGRPDEPPARPRHAPGDPGARARGAEVAGHRARLRADARAVRALRDRAHADRPPPRRARWPPRRLGLAVALAGARALGARPALRPRARPRLQRRHGRRRGCCGSRARRRSTTSGRRSSTRSTAGSRRRSSCRTRSRPSACARYGATPASCGATRGSRRSTTSPTSSPTRRCSAELGLDPARPIAVVRTPPAVSLYHRFENPLFAGVLERLRGEQTVVLPRTPEQRAELARRAASSSPSGRSTRSRWSRSPTS